MLKLQEKLRIATVSWELWELWLSFIAHHSFEQSADYSTEEHH